MPRNRNQPAVIAPLSDEGEMFMHMGDLLVGHRNNETLADLDVRLFGSHEAGAEAWRQHRPELMAEFPTAGQRCFGWWWYEQGIRWPIEQANALRELGELTADEEEQLAAWAGMTPEPPSDLGIDRPLVAILEGPDAPAEARPETAPIEAADRPTRPKAAAQAGGERAPRELITEEPHVDEPIQLEAAGGPGTAPVPEGRGSEERADQPQVGPDEAEVPDAATGNRVIEFTPWYQQHGRPREIEGWD